MERCRALIVNYNAGGALQTCLNALRDADVFAVTVVDNASSDDSACLASESGATLIRSDRNLGYGVGMNLAADGAAEPYLLLVNPDLTVEASAVRCLLDALDSRPRAGIASGLILDANGYEQRACRRRRPTPRRSAITALGLERWFEGVNDRGALPAEPVPIEGVSGALLLIRRECWEDLGGFDPAYFLHCEDLDLFARAAARDWQVWFVPTARATHIGGLSHKGRALRSEIDKHRGMLRYYRLHERKSVGWGFRWIWPLAIGLKFCTRAIPAWWADRR